MSNEETYHSVKWALEAGYRHIDTAEWYENEKECGRALNEWLSELPLYSQLLIIGRNDSGSWLTSTRVDWDSPIGHLPHVQTPFEQQLR